LAISNKTQGASVPNANYEPTTPRNLSRRHLPPCFCGIRSFPHLPIIAIENGRRVEKDSSSSSTAAKPPQPTKEKEMLLLKSTDMDRYREFRKSNNDLDEEEDHYHLYNNNKEGK
jgi:hypothetical protein